MSRPLRIAMLTHSTNPRGGVVHALELAEALTALGHEVVLHAPDSAGKGYFRQPSCEAVAVAVPAEVAMPGMTAMVEQRICDYLRHFARPEARDFDLFHAHDGISGNALATLKERGQIGGFLRTVHHLDSFADRRLAVLQDRSITSAAAWASVSADGQAELRRAYGILAPVVGNGVDRARFTPVNDGTDAALRRRLALGEGPIFLVVGGVEARKNTTRILEAFVQVRAVLPHAQLVIAGGASLLDHWAYRTTFDDALGAAALGSQAVRLVGPIPDAEMPALYRLATTLVFASVREGFGLCVIEAMASATPVVVSSLRPFTDYLDDNDALWCDPLRPASIANAMLASLQPDLRKRLIANGAIVAGRHEWGDVARRHLPLYASLKEPVDA